MATRSRSEAEQGLGYLFDHFREAIDVANRHFWTTYETDAHCITPGCRAGLLRCFIADELKQRLDGRPSINIIERNQTTLFCIGKDWVLQIHKFDEGCRTAKNETQVCMNLNGNDLSVAGLPGIPESATVVFLGYIEIVANRFAPEMRLSCPDGDDPAWVINLGAMPPVPPVVELTGGTGPQSPAGGTKVVVRQKGRKFSH